ncbi:Maf family protein [Maricaulis sp.]|uniref:Maf family protein n=1 Tax=Maricaulis sp. TaxID=1486257 RepID=UPI002623A5DE|nr:Maf family protein [Maricaulis sp.]
MTDFVLASGSAIRRQVLEQANVPFRVHKSGVDEDVLKREHADLSPRDMAALLARAKAQDVSGQIPEAFVLGADQTMELDGQLLDKLPERSLARDRLIAMRGKVHYLHSGLSICQGGQEIWTHQQTSTLHVRDFSDEFLDFYLDTAGFELTGSVGAYAYEGLGSQLFEKVEADYFAVLGLPLIPLMDVLREKKVILS